MEATVIVALCSLAGTLAGSLMGAITSTQLIKYRIDQLEDKVNRLNNLIERGSILEHEQKSDKGDLNELFKRLRDIELKKGT